MQREHPFYAWIKLKHKRDCSLLHFSILSVYVLWQALIAIQMTLYARMSIASHLRHTHAQAYAREM